MRFKAWHLYRFVLVGGTLVALGCAPSGTWAQQTSTNGQAQGSAQMQMQGQAQFSQDVHWSDWAALDQYLDAHPDVAQALKNNPDLFEDQNFQGQHPDFRDFCNGHPGIRQDLDTHREFRGWFSNRGELMNLTQFLSSDPEVRRQLNANPQLADDANYLKTHPGLAQYLSSHPDVKQALDRNPAGFMHLETRFAIRLAFSERPDVRVMNQFFASHGDMEKDLAAKPYLVNDQNYLKAHPDLEAFLNSHPQVRQAFGQDPTLFMSVEAYMQTHPQSGDYDRGGDYNRGGNRAQNGNNPNPDLNRGDLATMDQYLDTNPPVAQQLRANPSLINNAQFLSQHPGLQQFLNNHPQVKEEFAENPSYFMQREAQYERTENRGPGAGMNGNPGANNNPNPDLNRGEVASMDQFLDSNPKIAQQLESNPSLINNGKYLSENPSLRDFLNDHPQVREEFTENPSYFMNRENQFERTENGQPDVATMDAYLDKHHDEARDLDAYPARVNDSDYLSHHKDLDNFLKKHPNVREEFTHNPSAFMHQESSFDACAQFDDFLGHHRNVAKDLDDNPNNIKDANYMDHHKDLKDFLSKNPGVGDQVRNNPGDFMTRERRFEGDRQMDMYLSSHKSVAKDLQKNPDQVKDSKYLDHHKDLKQVLDKNPELAQAANTNPAGFWQEQVKFRQDYKSQQVQEKTKVQEKATNHEPH